MAGWSAAYDAVFAKYGFIVSNDLDEAVTIAAVLTTNPLPKGDRVAVLTVSGGAGIWGADSVSMQGLQVPELSESIQSEIKNLLPSYGATRNPIDVTAQGVHSGGLQKSIAAVGVCAERACAIRRRGAVGVDACRRRAAAGCEFREVQAGAAGGWLGAAVARYLRAFEIAGAVGSRQQGAVARRRHRAAG
jgi:hypothetical protein